MPFFFHPADLLMIPAMIIAVWAQIRVKSAYQKYAAIQTRSGMTGAQVAQHILQNANVSNVPIEVTPGEMTDHYDPVKKVLRLSGSVYGGTSIAALGIAAHEVGHAIQDASGYAPMKVRHLVYPISRLGSMLAFPLIFAGFILNFSFSSVLINLGIWLFTAAVAFTIVTLPVEFNASSRAVQALTAGGYMSQDELRGVQKVLGAAAMTYVAAAAAAVLQLIRFLLIVRGRD
ncbi:MAG: putative neutral zinc metallopeptidase [Candidatus Hydrogenedentes bacterium ADurb.Bin101]|jgi:Zn-dependent membrane protease YugP|nr:zinc metallopeptidase [Candidatus Hydrogenedentota bacterium]OQC04194.1 MAG: putative neutral zinc metallopeptidase [Candidatus Hydrogenedentes bacterium ADurb.Bin101]HOH28439.1 zinc metallopeptidase [Candidatus Hydrogenedentota bacterium]